MVESFELEAIQAVVSACLKRLQELPKNNWKMKEATLLILGSVPYITSYPELLNVEQFVRDVLAPDLHQGAQPARERNSEKWEEKRCFSSHFSLFFVLIMEFSRNFPLILYRSVLPSRSFTLVRKPIRKVHLCPASSTVSSIHPHCVRFPAFYLTL